MADVIRRSGDVTQLTSQYLEEQLGAGADGPLSLSRTNGAEALAKRIEDAPAGLLFPLYLLLNRKSGSSSLTIAQAGYDWGWESPSSTCSGHEYCEFFNTMEALIARVEKS